MYLSVYEFTRSGAEIFNSEWLSRRRFLGRGSMFVVSSPQFRRILQLPDDFRGQRLMDLGAGDGATTSLLAPVEKKNI